MPSSYPFPELQKSLQEVENPSIFGQVMAILVKHNFFHVLGAKSKYASHLKTYLATMVPGLFSRLMGSIWKVPEGFRKIHYVVSFGVRESMNIILYIVKQKSKSKLSQVQVQVKHKL